MSTALKWGSYSALHLSAEEVLQLAALLGFDVDHTSRKSIDSLYAEQPESLLKFTYGECLLSFWGKSEQLLIVLAVTQFWSATKRG